MGNKFFKKAGPFSISELSNTAGCDVIGDPELIISDVGTLEDAQASQIGFFNNEQYAEQLRSTKAGACIIKDAYLSRAPKGIALLITDNPYSAWAKILLKFYPDEVVAAHISPNADIHPLAEIGAGCVIEAGVTLSRGVRLGEGCIIRANSYIGEHVVIGERTTIAPNCFVAFCEIGKRCIIHPGANIGQDGFGFAVENLGILKVKQIGGVQIGNNVEIGAGACVDRGAINNTIIGDNVKIDNLVQIGHNVVIEKNCVIVAQSGIAGSSKLGEGVMLGGQAGIAGHLDIGAGAMIAAQSGVITDVKSKEVRGGYPAINIRQWHKQTIFLRKMTTNNG